jgi:hypothetical protein
MIVKTAGRTGEIILIKEMEYLGEKPVLLCTTNATRNGLGLTRISVV